MPAGLAMPGGLVLARRKPPSIAGQVRAAMDVALAHGKEDTRSVARVLIVDDELVVLHVMTWMLEEFGHTTWRAGNAAQALELLAGPTRFDLAIIDLVLPGMSGMDLAKAIRKGYPDLPMIAISGYLTPQSTYATKALQDVGIKHIILKPVRYFDLREAVRAALAAAG